MGLAQSKRSVNITTDPAKEGAVTEGAGKLEKIAEVDQLKSQANGDTQHNDGDNPTEDAAAAAAVAQEAASTTAEAGTSDSKTESAPTAAAEVTTTSPTTTTAADVTTTSASVDTTKLEEPAIEAVAVATQESAAPAVVAAPVAVPEKEPEVAKVAVVENGQPKEEEMKKPSESEEPAAVAAPKASEEEPEPEITTATTVVAPPAPVEEKEVVVEPSPVVVEVNTPSPSTTTTTTTTSAAVGVEKHPEEASVESASAAATSTVPPPPPSSTSEMENNTTSNVTSESELSVPEVVESAAVASDAGESTPPPPLPSIPPPSQVMVFVEASMSQVASEDPLVSVSVSPSQGAPGEEVAKRDEHVEANVVEGKPAAPAAATVVAPAAVDEFVPKVDNREEETVVIADGEVGPLKSSDESVTPAESPVVPATVSELAQEPVVVETEAPAVVEEPKPEPEPILEEEAVVAATVAPVQASPNVTDEIKETITKAVGEILEQAVDKIESGEAQLPPGAPAVPQAKEEVKAAEVLPIESEDVADKISNSIDDLPPPPPPPAVDDEETVPDSLPSPLPTIAAAVPAELMESTLGADEAKLDQSVLSVDISSPLPQNSLESLPSPPTLSQSDVSLPPPPESPTEPAVSEQQQIASPPAPETDSAVALPPPPSAPSSTNTTNTTSSSIPSSLPEANVEVAMREELTTPKQQPETVEAHVPVTEEVVAAAVEKKEEREEHKEHNNVPVSISSSSSSSSNSSNQPQQQETSTESDGQQQQQSPAPAPVAPAASSAEVEETVAQKQNGTVENGTSNGTSENGTTENGTVENGQNGVHETSATESLNGEAEHKKEDKIPEKAAQLQQPPPAAPEVTAE
uniref:Uncharacterized protein n=1 Tax=Anopheles atroparvus TaxID=41427 RepID=A0AAG5DEM0_ANOAO